MKRHLAWILLALAALAFVLTHVVWLAELPPRVATHFSATGTANGWMTRTRHGTFMLLTGLGLPAFILLIGWAIRFFPASMLNVPHPAYWRSPAHYPTACRIMLQWSQWQSLALLLWVILLNYQIVLANRTSPPRLSSHDILWLSVPLVLVTLASILWLIWRFSKVPASDPGLRGQATLAGKH